MAILVLLLFYLVGWTHAGAPSSNVTGIQATNATIFALEYGYSFGSWASFVVEFFKSANVTNMLIPSSGLASSQTPLLGPNVDTVYSNGMFDISANDLIVTIPEIDASRYWSFAFYSPIGDNFAVIGSINGSSSGANYTLRWNPAQTNWPSTGAGMVIDSPTAYGLILIRILVKNNNTDLAQGKQLIDACKLSIGAPQPSNGVAPFSFDLFANLSMSNFAYSILELTARLENAVPPFNVPDPGSVVEKLSVAGIYNGSYHNSTLVNLTSAGIETIAAIENYTASAFKDLNNGWITLKIQGLWGSNYLARAYTFSSTLEVLVQSGGVPPPSNWTNNWIPAPQDNTNFSVILRLYSPTAALTNGSWLYPSITEIAAIEA